MQALQFRDKGTDENSDGDQHQSALGMCGCRKRWAGVRLGAVVCKGGACCVRVGARHEEQDMDELIHGEQSSGTCGSTITA